jgi:hypothetical protein
MMDKQPEGQSVANLTAQLEGYAASVRANDSNWKDRLASWPAFAAATGSALALATAAGADIIYSGIQNLSVSITNHNNLTSNFPFAAVGFTTSKAGKMNLAGPTNFRLALGKVEFKSGPQSVHASLNGAFTTGAKVIGNGSNTKSFGRAELKRLASGAAISAGAGPFQSGGVLYKAGKGFSGTVHSGTWPKSARGFAGISFGQAGARHFGWIRMEWQDTNGVTSRGFALPNKLTAIDWAYESAPGVPILAGATPEPSTVVLALIATGSAGLLAWRKRRRGAASGDERQSEDSTRL